ncbi:MAG: alcohol dehydrogenase catalytic domain-containing protein [Candidatus Omnitrophica bacterium]|nr:alcohol dehydrogenase catalytic domain-containing protein [Candidatus Omnitrophota bacterium]
MRVAVYYSNDDLRLEERPIPKISSQEILLRVEAAGICGSDVMEWYRRDKAPLVLGHEIAGTIEEVGTKVRNYKKGDRITCAHHVPCDRCKYCLSGHQTVCETLRKTNIDPGGFAEFVRLPEANVKKGVFILPESVSFEEATFVEPLACVLRAQRLAGGVEGKSILVIGSGISGILHIHFARICGASFIVAVDISEFRLDAAKRFGADVSIYAKDYTAELGRRLNQQRLFELVIVATSAPSAILQAFESVERGGTVLFFAPCEPGVKIPVAFNELFWRTEIGFVSSYAATPHEYQEALDFIARGNLRLKEMITHRLDLSEIGLGFKLVVEARDSLKVIVYPTGGSYYGLGNAKQDEPYL